MSFRINKKCLAVICLQPCVLVLDVMGLQMEPENDTFRDLVVTLLLLNNLPEAQSPNHLLLWETLTSPNPPQLDLSLGSPNLDNSNRASAGAPSTEMDIHGLELLLGHIESDEALRNVNFFTKIAEVKQSVAEASE